MNNVEKPNIRDFEADRKIIEAATAGPWYLEQPYGHGHAFVVSNNEGNDVILAETSEVCARFIAEARTGWPAALDEIDRLKRYNRVADECLYAEESRNERLQAEIQRYRQALESLLSVFNGGYVTKNKPSAHVDNALRLAKEALSECS